MRFPALLLLSLSGPALAQSETMIWNENRFTDEASGAPMVALAYGVPETDNVLASLWCDAGPGYSLVGMDLSADVLAFADGDRVPVTLTAPGYAGTEIATIFIHEEGFWGLSLGLPLDHPLLTAFASPGTFRYALPDGSAESVPLAAPIAALRSTCSAAAGGRAK